MAPTRRNEDPRDSDKRTVDLFFGALFRLGIWTGDWETWYGTRPLGAMPGSHYPALREPRTTTRERHPR